MRPCLQAPELWLAMGDKERGGGMVESGSSALPPPPPSQHWSLRKLLRYYHHCECCMRLKGRIWPTDRAWSLSVLCCILGGGWSTTTLIKWITSLEPGGVDFRPSQTIKPDVYFGPRSCQVSKLPLPPSVCMTSYLLLSPSASWCLFSSSSSFSSIFLLLDQALPENFWGRRTRKKGLNSRRILDSALGGRRSREKEWNKGNISFSKRKITQNYSRTRTNICSLTCGGHEIFNT